MCLILIAQNVKMYVSNTGEMYDDGCLHIVAFGKFNQSTLLLTCCDKLRLYIHTILFILFTRERERERTQMVGWFGLTPITNNVLEKC